MDKASHSEVDNFIMCERKHYYAYGEKLQPVEVDEKQIEGIIGHAVFETYYRAIMNGATHVEAMEPAADTLWNECQYYKGKLYDSQKTYNKLSILIDWYWETYGAEAEKWDILEIEVLHTVQLTDEFSMPVKLDIIARIPGWGVSILDHKFPYNFHSVDKLDSNTQLPKYLLAARELGHEVQTIALNQCRTRETKTNKVDVTERFSRDVIPYNAASVVDIMREQMMSANRIGQLKRLDLPIWESKVIRNTFACGMCDFVDLCRADRIKEDQAIIRAQYYEPKTYR